MPLNAKDARIFIKFNDDGTRDDTRIEGANLEIIPPQPITKMVDGEEVVTGQTEEIIAAAVYDDGTYDELDLTNYIETSYADYMLYCGNSPDGKEYVRNMESGEPMEKPPYVPTQDELDEQEAAAAKNELQTLAVNAMMMSLADDDLVETKNTYQTKLRSISDGAALKVPELFPHWNGNNKEYVKGDKVLYNDVLYKVLQNHTSQEGWTPTSAPSLFAKVLTSEGEILDWEQPSSTNPYMKGDKVRYNGKVYESLIDNNVWSPDGYPAGWKLIEE